MRKDLTDIFLRGLETAGDRPPRDQRHRLPQSATAADRDRRRHLVAALHRRQQGQAHEPRPLSDDHAQAGAGAGRTSSAARSMPAKTPQTSPKPSKAKAEAIDRQTFALSRRPLSERTFQAAQSRHSFEENRRNLEKHLLPFWGDQPFADIKRPVVIERLEEIIGAGHHSAANRVHALVSKIFSFAIEVGLMESHPIAGLKKRGKEHTKDRVLSDDELRLFWTRIVQSPVSHSTGLALRLALLTGMRSSEVAGLRRDELHDLDDKTAAGLVLPPGRVKTKQTAGAAPALAPARHRQRGAGAGSRGLRRSCSRPRSTAARSRAMRWARRCGGSATPSRMATAPVPRPGARQYPTPHDLRRTLCTRLGMLGCADSLIERIANHTPQSVNRKHYNMHRYDAEKRQALEAWARELQAIVSGKKAASNVVRIGRAG